MRAATTGLQVTIAPGSSGTVPVEVTNTGTVIDGVTSRLVGFPDRHVTRHPQVLALFPDQTSTQTLTLKVPGSFPAGRHPLTVEVHSSQSDIATEYVDLELEVPAVPELTAHAVPEVIRARRHAEYVVTLTNRGNVPLEVSLTASDDARLFTITAEPAQFLLPPGTARDTLVRVRAPRIFLGTDLDRAATLTATARPANQVDRTDPVDPDLESPDPTEPMVVTTRLVLKHRALLTRGSLTALILLLIIGLWAAAFLFGIGQVFGADPLPKRAQPLFFVAAEPISQPSAAAAVSGGGAAADQARAPLPAQVQPAGAQPKSGGFGAGVGGTVAGRVMAASDGGPVGRILVEAQRVRESGSPVPSGSAATQADGSYQISGLFPGEYVLQFSAHGYDTIITPQAVRVRAADITTGVNIVIAGKPATISGTIDPGDTFDPVDATVELIAASGAKAGDKVAEVTAGADGSYTFNDVPAPADYTITVSSEGYSPTQVRASVSGGAARIQPVIILGSGTGSISGLVTDGSTELGSVTVSTVVDGRPRVTGTPTSGDVGQFVLDELPTPATYVLTFAKEGYGTTTVVVALGPGAQDTLEVSLTSGSGTVTGRVTGADGAGLGGVTVTAGGLENAPTTTTITDGDIGAFRLDGLPVPGTYTLTFTLAGFLENTVPVTLEEGTVPDPVDTTLSRAVGSVTGVVTDSSGTPLVGVTVTATSGKDPRSVTTTAASANLPEGGFVIDGLRAGEYTVTAVTEDGVSRTELVTVTAGANSEVTFRIGRAG